MKYDIKAHPTLYNGVQYRSRLEARWAAFFDLIGWKHEYEPIDLPGWSPDFRVVFPCEINRFAGVDHTCDLFVEVKPYTEQKYFHSHPSRKYMSLDSTGAVWLGVNPECAWAWINSGNAWDGMFALQSTWPCGYSQLWKQAGNTVQWKPTR